MTIKKVTETLYSGKYVNFQLMPYDPVPDNENTHFWEVINKKDGDPVAYIEWFKRWKKFCLFPYPDTVFEEICLGDISQFLIDRTKEKKN